MGVASSNPILSNAFKIGADTPNSLNVVNLLVYSFFLYKIYNLVFHQVRSGKVYNFFLYLNEFHHYNKYLLHYICCSIVVENCIMKIINFYELTPLSLDR